MNESKHAPITERLRAEARATPLPYEARAEMMEEAADTIDALLLALHEARGTARAMVEEEYGPLGSVARRRAWRGQVSRYERAITQAEEG